MELDDTLQSSTGTNTLQSSAVNFLALRCRRDNGMVDTWGREELEGIVGWIVKDMVGGREWIGEWGEREG